MEQEAGKAVSVGEVACRTGKTTISAVHRGSDIPYRFNAQLPFTSRLAYKPFSSLPTSSVLSYFADRSKSPTEILRPGPSPEMASELTYRGGAAAHGSASNGGEYSPKPSKPLS